MFSVFKEHKALLFASILLSALLSALSVSIAFILENILNAVTWRNESLLRGMTMAAVCYVAALAVICVLNSRLQKKLVVRTLQDMRQEIYDGIMSRDTERYHAVNSADYISALTNDVKIVEENVLYALLQIMGYLFVFLMSAAALFLYSPVIVGVLFLCLAAMYILPAGLGKPIGRRQALLSKSFAAFTVRLKDQLSGYDVIRSFQLADRSRESFAGLNREIARKRYRVDKVVTYSEGLSQVLGVGTQFLVMLISAGLVLKGRLTAGAMLGIVQLSASFVQPASIIMQSIPKVRGAEPVLRRIRSLSEKQPSSFTGTEKPAFRERISFEKVSFGYGHGPEQMVINNLSVVLDKNKKYALTGASGSGKTTLVRLLGAGCSGYSGQIRLDGLEFRDMDVESLLAMISVIHQNVYMFDETIKDNIDLHRSYSEDEWRNALTVSGVRQFLDQVPQGLHTRVGENGVNLSGGQRQRIAVARALIQKKPILILDEGTSAVDAPTAYDIETALLGECDITMLTITHNLDPELLRMYDGVLFMENGRITQAGSYDELISARGSFSNYARLSYHGDNLNEKEGA